MANLRLGLGGMLVLAMFLALAPAHRTFGETVTVEPVGEYAEIDTKLAIGTLQSLQSGSPEDRQRSVALVQAHPENYAPPVFYALSAALFESGKKDEAAFWFYAGQLRARFDANRCADVSARAAPGALNARFGPPINKYAFSDLAKLEALIPKVVYWDRKTPHNYDHRWINLHGMDAMIQGLGGNGGGNAERKPMSLPKEQWDKIGEDTRERYLEDFKDALAQLKGAAPGMGAYKVRRGEVSFGDNKVKDADGVSFQYLGGVLAKDKSHVFYTQEVIAGADPASFAPIGEDTGKDNGAVYFRSQRCGDCDPASFGQISKDWYADKNAAYDAMFFRRIPVERASFAALNRWYAKDSRSVFFMSRPIPGADAASFKLEECGQSEVRGEDKNRCYWNGNPVMCDCRRHKMDEFPAAWTPLRAGMSVLAQTAPLSIAMDQGIMEGGYLQVAPGHQTVRLNCWDGTIKKDAAAGIDAGPAKFYRIEREGAGGCAVTVKRPALIQGRRAGPEIRIQPGGGQKELWQIELPPGKHTLAVVCREVTRDSLHDLPGSLDLDLEAGTIYQLSARFEEAGNGRCNVWASPLAG
jgi:hypothetical protein